MGQYINKSAVVAEIERRINANNERAASYSSGSEHDYLCRVKEKVYKSLLSFLDTLEVKEEVISSDPIKAIKEALRMEYEKGRADVLRCIDPDEMVADFCSQPLSKTRSLASIYRQGIIDIVKRINNNEKTSINSTRSIDDGGVHRA